MLSSERKELFHRAKMKEVASFLKNEAVRKCLSDEEARQAYGNQRIIKARWVLTWKPVAADDLKSTPGATLHAARVVVRRALCC